MIAHFLKGQTRKFKEQFREALFRHFGKGRIEKLIERAATAERVTGLRPVAPDLWLVDRRGNHQFIEVKLPGDRIRPTQQLGMELIASHLRAKSRLSVEIIELKPESGGRRGPA